MGSSLETFMSFSALGLSAPLVQAVAQFDKPTPVQLAAIPEALTGGDLLFPADVDVYVVNIFFMVPIFMDIMFMQPPSTGI